MGIKMSRKIRIHNPEDVELCHYYFKVWLGDIFNPDSNLSHDERIEFAENYFDIKRFISSKEAIDYYDKDNPPPDLLIADIDFSEPSCGESTTAGIGIILKVKEKYPNTIRAYLTSQESEPAVRPTIDHQLQDLEPDCRIIRKNHLDQRTDMSRKLPMLIRKVTKKYLRKASPQEIIDIISCLNSGDDLKNFTIMINNEAWQIDKLFIGHTVKTIKKIGEDNCIYHEVIKINKEEFIQNIRNELATNIDITLAFSEAFGIYGIKQITHTPEKYYSTDSEILITKIENQILNLNLLLNQILTKLESVNILPNFKSLIEDYRCFEKEFSDKKNGKDSKELFSNDFNIDHYDSELDIIRNRKLRFGTSPNSQHLTISNFEMKTAASRYQFEIYIPIHEVFRDKFDILVENCVNHGTNLAIQCYAYKGEEYSEKVDDIYYKPHLFHNYLIFRLKCNNRFSKQNFVESIPSFIRNFYDNKFYLFGKYIMVVKLDGSGDEWHTFDCTYIDPKPIEIELNSIFPIESNCPVLDKIKSDNINNTYHVFKFFSWRQEQ